MSEGSMPIDSTYEAELGEITTDIMKRREEEKERGKPKGVPTGRQKMLAELRGDSVLVTDGRRCPD